jgi:hypothetical protein
MDQTIRIGVCLGRFICNQTGHEQLCMCTVYRRLNTYTKKIGFALPDIDNILDKLGHSEYFTHLALQSGFHQLRIKDYNDGVLNSRGQEIRGSDMHTRSFVPNMARLST